MGARLIIREDGNRMVSMPSLNEGIRNLEVEGSNPSPGITERPTVDWNAFERWLKRDKKDTTVSYTLTYAKDYQDCLWNSDLSRIADLPVSKRRLVMASLSNLAKFLGLYDQWKKTVHKFGLKWITMDVRDKRIIERLTKKMDLEAVYGWVKNVKTELPEYSDFMDFVAVTGMRLNEAIESWHMLRTIGNLNDYYDTEKEILLNYKFPEKFMRKGKKSFIAFVPRNMVEKIRNDYQPVIISRHQVRKRIVKRLGFEPKFSDLREAHASIMTKYLNQNEIDFIQGRVGTSVFMQNYFNPALISDLKQRVFEGIAEIQAKLS